MSTIVILLAILGVLLLRYSNMLGRKTGEENPSDWFGNKRMGGPERGGALDKDAPGEDKILPFPGRAEDPHADIKAVAGDLDNPTAKALMQGKEAEPSFDAREFLEGARHAYEMILMAFENGDKETLRPLLAEDVYDSFEAVIDERRAQGLSVDARFVGLDDSRITGASFDPADNRMEVVIRFDAQMITAVRDSSGAVVQGDPHEVRNLVDEWSFTRHMGAPDPNWLLTATG